MGENWLKKGDQREIVAEFSLILAEFSRSSAMMTMGFEFLSRKVADFRAQ